jgi:TonB family protein
MNSRDDITLHLVLELEAESARWRRRTFFLVSVLFHIALLGLLFAASGWIRRRTELMELAEEKAQQQPTFLFMPPDLLKRLKQPPKTNALSDQNRRAQGKAPIVTPSAPPLAYSPGRSPLPEIAGGGKPSPPPPPPPAPAPAPPKAAANGGGVPAPPPPKQADANALKLEDVPKPSGSNSQLALSTPGEAIQQSMAAAARGRAEGQYSGPGDSPGQFANPYSNFSTAGPIILSDTRGVDFGPYLARIVYTVRQNWYAVIPESARLGEKGRVALDFDIQKDGSVPDIDTAASSGSEPLDKAARAGIRASIPFPPLPSEFTGNHLRLRFIFLYNLGYGPQ